MGTKFVKEMAAGLKKASATQPLFMAQTSGEANSAYVSGTPNFPELYTFLGFLDEQPITRPATDSQWRLLYLDTQLMNWLLVEDGGIIRYDIVTDDGVPGGERDIVWVTADTAVGIGRGSQSLEAQFLTGEFTRAADFLASPAGGTVAAATGVFCEAQSVGCCRPSSRRRP